MKTKPRAHTRLRHPLWTAVALVAAASMAAGVATAAAAHTRGAKSRIVVSMSPSVPAAGGSFTMTFSLVKVGVLLPITGPDCLGMTNGRPAPLTSKTTDGTTATCTWKLPKLSGPTFDGMLVAFNSVGTEYFYGFDLPIG